MGNIKIVFIVYKFNGFGNEWLCGIALNFENTHQIQNRLGFVKVGENTKLLIAIDGSRF